MMYWWFEIIYKYLFIKHWLQERGLRWKSLMTNTLGEQTPYPSVTGVPSETPYQEAERSSLAVCSSFRTWLGKANSESTVLCPPPSRLPQRARRSLEASEHHVTGTPLDKSAVLKRNHIDGFQDIESNYLATINAPATNEEGHMHLDAATHAFVKAGVWTTRSVICHPHLLFYSVKCRKKTTRLLLFTCISFLVMCKY